MLLGVSCFPPSHLGTMALAVIHFLFSNLICWSRVSISSAVRLPAHLGMRLLPLVMMLRKS